MEDELIEFERNLTKLEKDFSEYLDKANIFEILNIVDKELKHSDFLAYILNPNNNHNLGSKPLELLCEKIKDNTNTNINIKEYKDIKVLREYKNMDILLICEKEKILICIENKIGTVNFEGQLEKYDKKLEKEFNNYQIIRLYLTPNCEYPVDYNGEYIWYPIGYSDILDILSDKERLKIKNIKNENVRCLLNDYIDNLRRNIVMSNKELKEKCNEIYLKHKKMFDLINENRDDEISTTTNAIKNYLREKSKLNKVYYKDNPTATTTLWFITPTLNKYLPSINKETSINSIRQNKCLGYFNIYIDRKNMLCYVGLYFDYTAVNGCQEINDASDMNKRINEFLQIYNEKTVQYKNQLYKNKQVGVFSILDKDEEEIKKDLNSILEKFLEK